ncbi:glycosyltransferase family 8 protein [Yinghuangia aomiensis]
MVVPQNLSGASMRRLKRHADRLGLDAEFRHVDAAAAGPIFGWVTGAVYLRLTLGEVLADVPRALYLDVDTLVLGDLRPLLQYDLDGALFGAVRDAQNPVVGAGIALPGWAGLDGVQNGRDYFNSGVLLLDLDGCRRAGLFDAARDFLTKHPDEVRLWDQDALNVAAADRWRRLDRAAGTPSRCPRSPLPQLRARRRRAVRAAGRAAGRRTGCADPALRGSREAVAQRLPRQSPQSAVPHVPARSRGSRAGVCAPVARRGRPPGPAPRC